MPSRPTQPPPKPPDFPPEKTYAALKKQLAALDAFRGRDYRSAENDEREWKNLTLNILIHGFGNESQNVSQFRSAKSVGEMYILGDNERLIQSGFDQRIEALAAMLRSTLAELELMMPESEIAGAYEPGEEYVFYRDLRTIVGFASAELFIIDNYLETQLFDVYMEKVNAEVGVRVLTDQVGNALKSVAEKFAQRGRFELRSGKVVHDRVVFADDRCWVIGQSIKDAAKRKPTYIVEHSGASTMKGIYETIWAGATSIVKG